MTDAKFLITAFGTYLSHHHDKLRTLPVPDDTCKFHFGTLFLSPLLFVIVIFVIFIVSLFIASFLRSSNDKSCRTSSYLLAFYPFSFSSYHVSRNSLINFYFYFNLILFYFNFNLFFILIFLIEIHHHHIALRTHHHHFVGVNHEKQVYVTDHHHTSQLFHVGMYGRGRRGGGVEEAPSLCRSEPRETSVCYRPPSYLAVISCGYVKKAE
jgi:hypothetical protein